MDIPQQHHFDDPNQAKAYFESCLDIFENSDATPAKSEKNTMDHTQEHHPPSSSSSEEQAKHNNNSSASTAVDYDYGQAAPSMPLVYPLLAEALVREGFPGLASMLTFTQDQRQLEQVAAQSMDHTHYGYENDQQHNMHSLQQDQQQQHQQHPSLQDENYLLDYVVQEHNMLMAQHGYSTGGASSSSSASAAVGGSSSYNNNSNSNRNNAGSNTPALDSNNNPYSLMGDMQPLELIQYNLLMSDNHYLDALPYSMVQTSCGADSAGGWCDSPQGFGIDSQGNYFQDQYSNSMHIPQQQPQQSQQYHHGFYDHSTSSSSGSSSNAGSSLSGSGSSSSSFSFGGLNMNGWSAAQLYSQGDQLLERKQQAAASGHHHPGPLPTMPGQVFAPHTRVLPHFEKPEDSDDDDDDADEFDHDDEDVPGMTSPECKDHHNGEDAHMPPLSLPSSSRSARRISQSQKQERHQEEHQQHGYQQQQHYHPYQQQHPSYRPYPVASKRKSDAGHQRRPSSGNGGHSRHSSMSSVHSNTSMMIELLQQASTSSPPSSSSSSSPSSLPSSPNSKGKTKTTGGNNNRSQMETIEKRMHPCTFDGCDKSFTRAFNLRSHLNTHNGERPHKCTEEGCDWDFVRRHDLDRHIKSKHMANKPYACKQCTSRFGRSDALQRHRRLENHV